MSGIAIFNAAVNQLQNQQHNLLKVRAARQQMEAEEEERDFLKKEREFKLEKMRRNGELTELQMDAFRSQTKAFDKQQDDLAKGKIAQINLAEHQAKTTADEALNWAKIGFKSDPQGVTSFLQAVQSNDQRKQMIVPKFSDGDIGYETKDIEAYKPGYTRENVITTADKLARDNDGKIQDYISQAESLLRGNAETPGSGLSKAGHIPERPVTGQNTFKPVEGMKDAEGNPVPAWKQKKMFNEKNTQAQSKQNNQKVQMRLPNGQSVYIPKANVEAARKRGAVLL